MTGHKERLLKYLKENGKITTMEAIQNLRNTRLIVIKDKEKVQEDIYGKM